MNVEQLHISELIPYEFNSRNHPEEQIDRIANSIKEFGFNQPIVIDKANVIIAGHGASLPEFHSGSGYAGSPRVSAH